MSLTRELADLSQIFGFFLALVSLIISYFTKNKVDELEIEIETQNIEAQNVLLNPVVENLTIISGNREEME